MKAAELLVRCLENEGVQLVFGLPGEETLELMDALLDSRIRFIETRHEQGASFMADVCGRLSGKAGICVSTLGPGATNLLTGVVDAYLDRAPLVAITGPDDLVLCDVGAHKLWMARMFPCEVPNSCIISNGFAAMGIAVLGAIAAKLWSPERRVIAVTGDSGFLMNAQELETAVRLELPLVILVWRDNGYGVIRWKQLVRFGRNSSVEFGNPDLLHYANSFGAACYRVADPSELRPVIVEALNSRVPAVIDCPVYYTENLRLTERLKSLPS